MGMCFLNSPKITVCLVNVESLMKMGLLAPLRPKKDLQSIGSHKLCASNSRMILVWSLDCVVSSSWILVGNCYIDLIV